MTQRANLTFARVDGHEDLVRDINTGAVHNLNRTALQQARMKKKSAQRERDKVASLEKQVADLTKMVQDLRQAVAAAASAYKRDPRFMLIGHDPTYVTEEPLL